LFSAWRGAHPSDGPVGVVRLPAVVTDCLAACAGALLPPAAAAAQKTDTVVMGNGDRVTCEIKKLDRGILEASTDSWGTLTRRGIGPRPGERRRTGPGHQRGGVHQARWRVVLEPARRRHRPGLQHGVGRRRAVEPHMGAGVRRAPARAAASRGLAVTAGLGADTEGRIRPRPRPAGLLQQRLVCGRTALVHVL